MEENIQAYVVPLCTKNVYSEYSLGDTVFSVKIPVKVDVKTGCFATSVNHAIYRTEIEVNGTENKFHIKTRYQCPLVVQQIKDPVLSLQLLRSLLWHRFHPGPRNLHRFQVQPKKNPKQKNK